MRLCELFEATPAKVPATQPRNFVAKNAQTTGAGAHKANKKGGKPVKGEPQSRGAKHRGWLNRED